MADTNVLDILHTYRKRLLNLSSRNRSLLLLKPYKSRYIDLNELDFTVGKQTIENIESLLKGKITPICPCFDEIREGVNRASLDLNKIYRAQQAVFEEQGSYDLCVGWPFIQGKMMDDSLVRCPLLLFPVTLFKKGNKWVVELRVHEIIINPSFVLFYSHANKVPIDKQLLEFCIDEKVDFTQTAKLLYDTFSNSSYKIHFSSDIFKKKVNNFQYYNRKLLNNETKTGVLDVFQEAVLGFFPQSTSSLLHDYDTIIDKVKENQISDFDAFFEKKKELDVQVKESRLFAPFKMDVWQEQVLEKVNNGASLVVQGPPGSGKSQLIANLISNAVTKGKSFLLVCQKRVALDVVYNRLKEFNFSDFVGLIHDYKQDRKGLYKQLGNQIDSINEYKHSLSSYDSINIERKYIQISNQIDALCDDFQSIKKALFDSDLCGIRIIDLYVLSDRNALKVDFSDIYSKFQLDSLDEYKLTIEKYFKYYFNIKEKGPLWLNRKNFSNVQIADYDDITKVINDASDLPKEISKQIDKKLNINLNIDDLNLINNHNELVKKLSQLNQEDNESNNCNELFKTIDSKKKLSFFQQKVDDFIIKIDEYKGFKMNNEEFLRVDKQLKDYIKHNNSFFKIIYWKNFTNRYESIKTILANNYLKFNRQGLQSLTEYMAKRKKLISIYNSIIKTYSKTPDLDFLLENENISKWNNEVKSGIYIYELVLELKEKIIWLNKIATIDRFVYVLKESIGINDYYKSEIDRYSNYLSKKQIDILFSDEAIKDQYISQLNIMFSDLCSVDKFVNELDAYWLKALNKLNEAYSSNNTDGNGEKGISTNIIFIKNLFINSLTYYWLVHAERYYPQLKGIGGIGFKNDEQNLITGVNNKLELAKGMVLEGLKSRTFENLEYNRLNNRITYRNLYSQVKKKRKIWPIRKLFSNFSEEILKLIPCWLASPESVSAAFPMARGFDLVVFDEASQCFAERGIPALMRAKQAVIVGDSQQLQPYDFASTSKDDFSDKESFETEAISLLDLIQKYYNTISLRGHYRSQHDALIRFSNEHFYNNSLVVVPNYTEYKRKEAPITYKNIYGRWLDKQNVEEAKYISNLLDELLRQNIHSIGVITFNVSQRDLITDLWSERGNDIDSSDIFIKNIENVQGDERDVIIFSVGYGFDENNRLKAQFGSLNITGGENRLNVVASRARKKIIIISSFEPHQLEVSQTLNEGPKVFKKFLQFAKSSDERYENSTTYTSIDNYKSSEMGHSLRNIIINHIIDRKYDLKLSDRLFADIHLVTPAGKHLLIIIDSGKYYNNENPKEYHTYLPQLLTTRGWDYICLYSRQYWWNSTAFFKSLEDFIQENNKVITSCN